MNSSTVRVSIPSEVDDEVDDAFLPHGEVWAYTCKLASCPDYGKSWQFHSNFLCHLQDQEAHMASATTPAVRRAIELKWRYATDPHLPPRKGPFFRSQADLVEYIWEYSFKDHTDKVVNRRATQRQME